MKRWSGTRVGVAAGVLFFAHALVPGSNAWPIIWPALAGSFAVHSAGTKAFGFFPALGSAVKVGLVAGLVFLVATAAALAALGTPTFAPLAQALGAAGAVVMNEAVLLSLAAAALIGTVAAALAGAVTYAVTPKKSGVRPQA